MPDDLRLEGGQALPLTDLPHIEVGASRQRHAGGTNPNTVVVKEGNGVHPLDEHWK